MMSFDGHARSPSSRRDEDITVLWQTADGESTVQCVLSWNGRRYRVRLVRGDRIVKDERALDDVGLVVKAAWWRREFENGGIDAVERLTSPNFATRHPCPKCRSSRIRIVGQSGTPPLVHYECEACGHVVSRRLYDE